MKRAGLSVENPNFSQKTMAFFAIFSYALLNSKERKQNERVREEKYSSEKQ